MNLAKLAMVARSDCDVEINDYQYLGRIRLHI
jgi:hypothetical protein